MAQALRQRLGPLVSRTRSTVEPAYKWAEKQTVDQYSKLMEQNKQYVVEDPAAAEKLGRQFVFTNLARFVVAAW